MLTEQFSTCSCLAPLLPLASNGLRNRQALDEFCSVPPEDRIGFPISKKHDMDFLGTMQSIRKGGRKCSKRRDSMYVLPNGISCCFAPREPGHGKEASVTCSVSAESQITCAGRACGPWRTWYRSVFNNA